MGLAEDVQAYLIQPHDVVVFPEVEEDGTLAYISMDPGLPGCISDGRTPEEAAINLEDARMVYVDGLLARGIQPPVRVYESAGTSMSYRSVSVVLSCCEPPDDQFEGLQTQSFDVPRVASEAYA